MLKVLTIRVEPTLEVALIAKVIKRKKDMIGHWTISDEIRMALENHVRAAK